MITFLKAQVASIVGTVIDFLSAILLVEVFHCWYLFGSSCGNLIGGITQFSLARNWVFEGSRRAMFLQIAKYGIVWMGNTFLSAVLVYLLTSQFALHYVVSKLIVSAGMGLSYNYILQKNFVFK